MRTASATAALGLLLLLGLTGVAGAGQFEARESARKLVYVAAAGETNRVTLSRSGATFELSDAGATVTLGEIDGQACSRYGTSTVRCTLPEDFRFDVTLGDGDDEALLTGPARGVLAGGPGGDRLVGGDADDVLRGDAGDDRLRGGGGGDWLWGGEGRDVVDYAGETAPVAVTPESGIVPPADDGAAGEGDRVAADVEGAVGGDGADTLTAGPGGGTLTGGAGADKLTGAAGDDTLDGGAGVDALAAGDGADHLLLRDGVAESATCGAGADTVEADPDDNAAPDCEVVQAPFAPPGLGGPSGTAGDDPAAAPPPDGLQKVVPVAGRTFGAAAAQGEVLVKLPGSGRFVALGDARAIPVGSTVDARRGTVSLRSAGDLTGGTQVANFSGAAFAVHQQRRRKPVTELRLRGGSFARCGRARAATARGAKPVRRLWGSGKGRFSTRGRDSVATVRGTVWLTEDRCGGTYTEVKRGVVAVRELAGGRTVVLRAGQSHLARHRRG